MSEIKQNMFKAMPPGVVYPWEERVKEMTEIKGDPELVKKVWTDIDTLAYLFTWYWVQR